ncbi:MAG TPA: reverse transcriptase domain-containing protein [Gemmatimonadaceae bacterium]|nr:reverse transcriptase domain-containing protein [Gemmatimonadaceae bacterium]
MSQVTSTPTFDAAFSREALGEVWNRLKEAKTDLLDDRIKIPAGWDGLTVARFERQLPQHLAAIERRVRSGRYQFRPFLFHFVSKVDGGERKIAYSGIRDRIVQAALHDVLAPVINARLTDSAFAYRTGVSTYDAIRRIYSAATSGQPFFVKSDFVKFFDRLDHARLKTLVDGLDVDARAQRLAWRFVRAGDIARAVNRASITFPAGRRIGVPQGGVISGLLANLYLCAFDEAVQGVSGTTLVRYADDFVVLCRDESTCQVAFDAVATAAREVLLELHEGEKTVRCGHINDGITFVGFRLRGTKVAVKPTNVAKFKRRIQAVLALHETRLRDGEYASPRECVRQALRHVNLKIMGVEVDGGRRSWIACFRIINDVDQVRQLDRWVWRKLSLMTRRLGLPHRTRSEIFGLGYRGLLREYWRTRRQMRSLTLPFQGMIRTSVERTGVVVAGPGAYSVLKSVADAPADEMVT